MDLNTLLIWTVAASCGISIFHMLTEDRRAIGRFRIAVGVLMFLGVMYFTRPERSGLYAGAAWALLMVFPAMCFSLMNHFMISKRYRWAQRCAWLVAWFHPFDGHRDQPAILDALEHLRLGNFDEGKQILARIVNSNTTVGRTALILQTRLDGAWDELIQRLQQPSGESLLRDPAVIDTYLQALGETGQIDRMFSEYHRLMARSARNSASALVNFMRMRMAALVGDVELTQRILNRELRHLDGKNKSLWLATAQQRFGLEEQAETILREIRETQDSQLSVNIERRLDHPLSPVPLLDYLTQVESLRKEVEHDADFAVLSTKGARRPVATWLLAVALLAAFVMEIPGGAESESNLVDLGAMVIPLSVVDNQWWRIFTASFLHFGPMHLLLNVFGLILFGRMLENIWGPGRLLACYVTCSVCSIAFAIPIYQATVSGPMILVGASGGVMGLIGALLGHMSVGISHGKSQMVKREFKLLAMVVALQIAFDLTTPMVSSVCHMLGMGCGFTIAVISAFVLSRRNTTPYQPTTPVSVS